MTKLITWLTGLLTLLLSVFTFILSFNALTDLAQQHGVSIPPLFPFVVEFAVIVFSLNALYRSLNNEPAKWQWCLIIFSSLLAGTFNIIHANSDIVSRVIAAMPSLFLLLSFETFLNLIRYSISKNQLSLSINQLTTMAQERQNTLDRMDDTIYSLQTRLEALQQAIDTINAPKDEVSTRRNKLLSIIHNYQSEFGTKPTQSYLSEQVGVSVQTIRGDLKAINGVGK